jgi:hypothetical protein
VIAPYDHDALWSKAKVFLNRAMDPDPVRSFDEQALWAAAALELLGKAALARVSPLLIAEPTEEGVNILIATGLIAGTAKFSSVSASTIFKRCQRAFRPFSAADALRFADARNEYLHGSAIGFMTLAPQAWWSGLSAFEWLGPTWSRTPSTWTIAPSRWARQRLAQYRAGTLPARVQMEWQSNADLTAGLSYSTSERCPACGDVGTLEGDESGDMSYEYDRGGEHDEGNVWARVNVPADYFSCQTCHSDPGQV